MLSEQENANSGHWKDPAFVESWKEERRQRLETAWALRAPLFSGLVLSSLPKVSIHEDVLKSFYEQQTTNESLLQRARRLENSCNAPRRNRTSPYRVPSLIFRDDNGSFSLSPWAERADQEQIKQAEAMIELGLPKKAQRVLACSLLGGEVTCQSGHKFSVKYACGSRYCRLCGPKAATRLFARYCSSLSGVTSRLLRCGVSACPECDYAEHAKTIPHWPPCRAMRPRNVIAKLDFTLKNTGKADSERVKFLNNSIRRFFRTVEKQFGVSRKHYGVLWCDELGGNNTNVHAHAVYVGPWLPQKHKELSRLWSAITKDGSFIVSIKYAKNFSAALMHALKYPAKFAQKSTPQRRAELEKVFHRTRRVHALAAFYNPKQKETSPESTNLPGLRCPICNERVSEPSGWRPMAELEAKGLQDIRELHKQNKRDLVLGGSG